MKQICDDIVDLVEDNKEAKAVLFCGSGTLAIESVISSVVGNDRLMVVVNGAYGERIVEMAKCHNLNFIEFESDYFSSIDFDKLDQFIELQKPKYLAFVHSETTSGLLNSMCEVSRICKKYDVKIIADCISSFGAYPISLKEADFIVATSNKNLQSVAGVSFVIAK